MTEPFVVERGQGRVVVSLTGTLGVESAGPLYDQLRKLAEGQEPVVLDFAGVESLESAGIAVISLASSEFEERGLDLAAENLAQDHRRALQMMPSRLTPAPGPENEGFFVRVGDGAFATYDRLLDLAELVYDTGRMALLTVIRKRKLPVEATIEQAVLMGVDALFIILLLSFLLGLIIAFQSAHQLAQFGANIYVANLVGIAMVREFGPMMTAIMLAGRSGSAIAAELGTMQVSEEVDALKTMGIDPIRFLVLPRVVALTLVQPILTLMADFIGMVGGFIIGVLMLDLSTNVYYEQTVEALTLNDFGHGLLKSVLFAWVISITGCFSGLSIQGGAASVGRATTKSVVTSIFLIIVVDSIFATVSTILKAS